MAQKRQRNRREENAEPSLGAPKQRNPTTTASIGDALLASAPATAARRNNRSPRSRPWIKLVDYMGIFIAIGVVVLFGMLIWEVVIPTRKQRIYLGTLSITLIPVLIAAYTVVRPGKPLHRRVTPLALVLAIVGRLFPTWFAKGIAALGLFGLGWVTRPGMVAQKDHHSGDVLKDKSSDVEDTEEDEEKKKLLSKPNQPGLSKHAQQNLAKAAACAILLAVVMLTENFFVWVVSATYEKGWSPVTAPDALQDNGRRVLQDLFQRLEFTKREVVSMRRVWNIQYALVASLGIGLSIADFHPTRQLWSLASRGILTMTSARSLRTISFLLTVLPSQDKFCFGRHYPNPPPTGWWDWIMVGMTPNSSGGCNDLIVSGHATVTATMACVSVSLADDHLFSLAVGWLLAMDYLVEVYEGFHYSVDMWMGAVLCSLLWRVWKPIEDNNTDRNEATLQDMADRFRTEPITVSDAIIYGSPVLISYLQCTVFPEFSTNFIMLGYTVWCAIQLAMQGFQHYTKHLLFCVLYIAIGVYL